MIKKLNIFLMAIFIAGCASKKGIEKLYEGPDRPPSEVVTLYPVSLDVGSAMLYIDGKHPGNCFTGCAFYNPIYVLAGPHKFTGQMYAVPLKKDAVSPEFPTDSGKIHSAANNPQASGIFAEVVSLVHEESFEGGKSYQLEFGFKEINGTKLRYFWWKPRE